MFEDEIYIRIGDGRAFIYTIVRAGAPLETALVQPVMEPEEEEEPVAGGYYGGSRAMD